jgi:CRP/FNR family transcriptional regulator, cyclic AMP receptor protein
MDSIELVEQSPLFSRLDRHDLEEIVDASIFERWSKDCEIQAVTDKGRFFRVILNGRVKITRSNLHNGRELSFWLLGPGDGFDILTLLDYEANAICARTLDEVSTLAVPLSAFQNFTERFPELRVAVHRYVARQLHELIELATDLALHDTMTRLTRFLLRHVDAPKQLAEPKVTLIRDLPQEEIAFLIGSVRIVVNRLLKELKKQAVIDTQPGRLRVLDVKRLMVLAEECLTRDSANLRQTRPEQNGQRVQSKLRPRTNLPPPRSCN